MTDTERKELERLLDEWKWSSGHYADAAEKAIIEFIERCNAHAQNAHEHIENAHGDFAKGQ